MKTRSREIGCYYIRVALNFNRYLGRATAEVPVKFQSDWKSLKLNLAASRLHDILQHRLMNGGPALWCHRASWAVRQYWLTDTPHCVGHSWYTPIALCHDDGYRCSGTRPSGTSGTTMLARLWLYCHRSHIAWVFLSGSSFHSDNAPWAFSQIRSILSAAAPRIGRACPRAGLSGYQLDRSLSTKPDVFSTNASRLACAWFRTKLGVVKEQAYIITQINPVLWASC